MIAARYAPALQPFVFEPIEAAPDFVRDLIGRGRAGLPPSSGPDEPASATALRAGADRAFLRHLDRGLTELPHERQRVLRILHFGDSQIWDDHFSGDLRRRFQSEFGDGGRGLVAPYHGYSFHLQGHRARATLGRTGYHVVLRYTTTDHELNALADESIGFLGRSHMIPATPWSSFQQAEADAAAWQKVQVLVRLPPGPERKVQVQRYDDQRLVARAGLQAAAGCEWLDLSVPGLAGKDTELRFDSDRSAPVYIDAINLESEHGVAYSTVTLMGIHLAWMGSATDENRRCGFSHYQPELVILSFGVNEAYSLMSYAHYTIEAYESALKTELGRLRRSLPNSDFVLIGTGEVRSLSGQGLSPYGDAMREIQARTAESLGMAFYDQYAALGGPGQSARLQARGFLQSDLLHFTPSGSRYAADLLYEELTTGVHIGAAPAAAPGPTARGEAGADAGVALFQSRAYLYFLGAVLVGAGLVSRWPTVRIALLLGASYVFYASWVLWPLLLLIASTTIDYVCALALAAAGSRTLRKRAVLVVSIVANLGLLGFFKYGQFFTDTISPLFLDYFDSSHWTWPLLPAGISFYTFQSMSYTIDVYRGILPAERNPLRFAMYVAFFPQLIAGPIVRAAHFLPDMAGRARHFAVNDRRFGAGLFTIAVGLLKKSFADRLALSAVDDVFAVPGMFSPIEIALSVYAYGLQIYWDFSGYTDIALGSAALLGFRLTHNFNQPYRAQSISDFWRRWHISLGSWLRDYLYIPLGGARRRPAINLLVTMLLCGLWHGTGWQFVLWGLYHGLLMVLERWLGLGRRTSTGVMGFLRSTIALHLVLAGWILFRAAGLSGVGNFLQASLQSTPARDLQLSTLAIVGVGYLIHFLPVSWFGRTRAVFVRSPWPLRGFTLAVFCLGLWQLQSVGYRPFIYFQF